MKNIIYSILLLGLLSYSGNLYSNLPQIPLPSEETIHEINKLSQPSISTRSDGPPGEDEGGGGAVGVAISSISSFQIIAFLAIYIFFYFIKRRYKV